MLDTNWLTKNVKSPYKMQYVKYFCVSNEFIDNDFVISDFLLVCNTVKYISFGIYIPALIWCNYHGKKCKYIIQFK